MFANKVILITGGSSGIGAAAVECFAKEGASVVFVGRNEAKLKAVAERCGPKTYPIKADISKDEEAKSIVKKTIEKFGKLDVLVNNAGIFKYKSLRDSNAVDVYDEILKTNTRAVILITTLAIPYIIQTKGNIINISSVVSTTIVEPGMTLYGMSKAALDHYTKGLALDLAKVGVRVNSVNPGPVITDLARDVTDFPDIPIDKLTALGRASDPEEIGDIIVYLASDKARGVTGSMYHVDNGALLH
ncbi:unnamed protein product [Chrysodeixis includens]|uniref:Uncharacterized protein n=1 Tax=Chrysodeixis includens TaxID=689277 RepID=A0A9P0BWN1_CHRIL|nr:unnamed protein product [Chrysodeixis includens]